MKSPHQILARRHVDGCLAADGRVNLGEQGCRNLHELASALEDCSGKADQVADHAPAERDDG